MKRAKTLSGLLLQTLRVRWAGLGRGTKTFLLVGVLLTAATALQFSFCLMGGCPSQSRPCDRPCEMAESSDEPCPFSAQADAHDSESAEDESAEDEDVPCHARQ